MKNRPYLKKVTTLKGNNFPLLRTFSITYKKQPSKIKQLNNINFYPQKSLRKLLLLFLIVNTLLHNFINNTCKLINFATLLHILHVYRQQLISKFLPLFKNVQKLYHTFLYICKHFHNILKQTLNLVNFSNFFQFYHIFQNTNQKT